MAVITKTDLENAKLDAEDLSSFVNDAAGDVTPRTGGVYPNLRKVIANAEIEVDNVLDDMALVPRAVLIPTATDDYLRRLVGEIQIGNGDKTDSYYMNYQTQAFGTTLYRLFFYLHSTDSNAVVAQWLLQTTSDPTANLPPIIYGTLMGDGVALPGDVGITFAAKMNWDALELDKILTTYTDNSATGIKSSNVLTSDDLENRYLDWRISPHNVITVGASGYDFDNVVTAINSLEDPNTAGTISRSTYPSSSACSPEYPTMIWVAPGFEQEITYFTHLGIDQSRLRIPHGCILYLSQGSRLWMNAGANSSPVVELNFSGRIEGTGTIEQLGLNGYVIHMDVGNKLSNQAYVRRRIQTCIKGITLKAATGHAFPMIAGGFSNRQTVLIDGISMIRTGAVDTSAFIFFHNSPNTIEGGNLIIRNVWTNQPDIASSSGFLSLLKQFDNTARHNVSVDGCRGTQINYGNGAGITGSCFALKGTGSGMIINDDGGLAP